jgi:hypothetical protein
MAHIIDFKTVLAKKVPISHDASFRRIFVSIFRLTRKDGVIQPNPELSPDPYFPAVNTCCRGRDCFHCLCCEIIGSHAIA